MVPVIAVGMITATDVPFAITGGNPKRIIIAGTMTTPPPTPSKPAKTPETAPMTKRSSADHTVRACSTDEPGARNNRIAEIMRIAENE